MTTDSAENRQDMQPGKFFCFGLGFTCSRLAGRLINAGWNIVGTKRNSDNDNKNEEVQVKIFTGESKIEGGDAAFSGVTHILASIPPGPEGDLALLHHKQSMLSLPSLQWVGYLSTPAVYGDRNGGTVHEDDVPRPGSVRGKRRLSAERAWVEAFDGTDVSVQIFRLSGIYGPGRSAIDQLRNGTARIIDKPGQVFNRIHVDDIGTILQASMRRPSHGRIYNVADNEACPSGDVIRYAAELLGMEPPEPIPFDSAALSPMARSFYAECKRLDTARIKSELDIILAYPTYREGLRSILENE